MNQWLLLIGGVGALLLILSLLAHITLPQVTFDLLRSNEKRRWSQVCVVASVWPTGGMLLVVAIAGLAWNKLMPGLTSEVSEFLIKGILWSLLAAFVWDILRGVPLRIRSTKVRSIDRALPRTGSFREAFNAELNWLRSDDIEEQENALRRLLKRISGRD